MLTGSGVDRVGSKIRVGRWPGRVKNPGRALAGSGQTSESGVDRSR